MIPLRDSQPSYSTPVVTLAILGTPYAIRYLLRSLGRRESPALFAIPLTWNAHLILGFLNFIAAIPLCFVGLGLASYNFV